jgi:hypothetical protein
VPEAEALLATAARLLLAAGLPGTPRALLRLTGGRNNRVFRLERDVGASLVLKHYHVTASDTRNRLGAEWAFLQHAWFRCGVRQVPQPLASEAASHTALYPFIPGRKLAAAEVGAAQVAAAAALVGAINPPGGENTLAAASEACFSMAAHIETVERRVARLVTGLDPAAPHAAEACALVQDRLVPAWRRLASGIAADDIALPACVSPSDFGFHNALVAEDGTLTFIDFEYAGRDDPAKLVCDFFCQPEVPVPLASYAWFRDAVLGVLGLDAPAHRARCDALLPAYRVKWACIMLNDFIATDALRRDFAEAQDRATRCATQLAKASDALSRL